MVNVNPVDILVLEDMVDRVEWLKETFPYQAIVWAPDVDTFSKVLDEDPRVLILDHDLGENLPSGMDACRLIPGKISTDVPIIIWSHNPDGASNMKSYLKACGFQTVVHLQFGFKEYAILASLVNILR